MKITMTQLRTMVQEEINKLNEKEKEDVNEEMDLTADEEESIKKYLAKRKAQGKPADYLKREEERLRKMFARKKAAGDGTISAPRTGRTMQYNPS